MKKFLAIVFAIFFILNCFALETSAGAQGSENSKSAEIAESPRVAQKFQKKQISFIDSSVLGAVEGLTEYLPVSSTGHLILASSALNLDNDTVVGELNGESYTMKMAVDSYCIVIQIGAIFAVIFVYSSSIKSILFGLFGKDKEGLFLARNLIVAFLPAALIGFLLHDFIAGVLFGIYPVIIALFLGGLLMLFVQKKYEKKARQAEDISLSKLSIKQSLSVGFLQCLAMCPGVSRSMATILGGYLVGLSPVGAAKFSFLLGLVTLSAASLYKLMIEGLAIFSVISFANALWGIFLSFVFAVICVKLFVKILAKYGLAFFAWYRIMFSLILFAVFYNA